MNTAVRTVRDPNTGRRALGFRGDGLPTDDYLPVAQADRQFGTPTGLGVPRLHSPTGPEVTSDSVQDRIKRYWSSRRDSGNLNPRTARSFGQPPRGLGAPGELPFLPPRGALSPQATANIPPGGRPQQFIDPGAFAGCPPRGKGVGWFGFYFSRQTATTAQARSTQPELPVRITQVIASSGMLHNWRITQFDVNRTVIKHGGDMPASVFAPWARYPVPFDLRLATSDRMIVSATPEVDTTEPDTYILQIGGMYCFTSTCYSSAYPCDGPILKEGTRQIIIGLGSNGVSVSENDNSGTSANLTDTADQDTLLGNLILDAVLDSTGTPQENTTDIPGLTATDGMRALSYIGVGQIDVNNVILYTSNPGGDTESGTSVISDIPGMAFGAESSGVFFPDIIVDSSQNLNVRLFNRTAAGSGTEDNTIRTLGAFVGCMLACDAA